MINMFFKMMVCYLKRMEAMVIVIVSGGMITLEERRVIYDYGYGDGGDW